MQNGEKLLGELIAKGDFHYQISFTQVQLSENTGHLPDFQGMSSFDTIPNAFGITQDDTFMDALYED